MRIVRFTSAPDCEPETDIDEANAHLTLYGAVGDGLSDGVAREAALGNHAMFAERPDLGRLAAADGALATLIRGAAPTRPRRVTILVHGYEFEPRLGHRDLPTQPNPHRAIFHGETGRSVEEEHRTHETPWLARLDPGADDLVIPFAYCSDAGRLASRYASGGRVDETIATWLRAVKRRPLMGARENLFAYGYIMAGAAGHSLAAVISALTRRWGEEGLRIDIVAHSLGARVVAAALKRLVLARRDEPGVDAVDQVIFLAAALSAHQVSALGRTVWSMTKAGWRTPNFQVFNFTSGSDRLLRFVGAPLADRIGERLDRGEARPSRASDLIFGNYLNFRKKRRTIVGIDGGGSGAAWLNWLDFPLDHPATEEWALAAGLDLAGELASCRFDHWVHFTHAENWKLYNRIMTDKADWTIDAIRSGRSSGTGRLIRPPFTARSDERYEPVVWSKLEARRRRDEMRRIEAQEAALSAEGGRSGGSEVAAD